MILDMKNGTVPVGNTEMAYVSFGHGRKNLIVLPGLSDGLSTVKGKAMLLAKPYRPYLEEYTVYMFSRKDDMPKGYTIRDMAADQAAALETLGIRKTAVLGVSQGGMIAQYLAADYPELVEKLVLAVTAPCANPTVRTVVREWIGMAKRGDHKQLMADTAEKTYTDAYLRKKRYFLPLLGLVKPKSYRRFLINAYAILHFNAADTIHNITCPTLIIGGACDKTVGTSATAILSCLIPQSELYVYRDYGHGVFDEAKDFYRRVLYFLESEKPAVSEE